MHGLRPGATVRGPTSTRPGGRRALTMLVSSAGRRVGLLQAFRDGAERLGVDLRLVACDLDPELSAACRIADDGFPAPPAADPAYADTLLAECGRRGVTLIVPTIDPELLPLAHASERFAAHGIRVVIGQPTLVAMARDKLATARFLADAGIPSPATTPFDQLRGDSAGLSWPLIVKPRHGSASRAITVAHSPAEIPTRIDEAMIAQALLQGEEWTVNLFFDAAGQLRAAVPHRRIKVRAGEVEKGVTQRVAALTDISRRLAERLPGPRGPLCYQAMIGPDGAASVFEINARFGGGYPLADHAGATFARWLIEEQLGLPSTAGDCWAEGVTMLRYDAAVFVPPCP